MLRGLLKKKVEAGATGVADIVDKSILDRRLKRVLERPTRHEFNPPQLSPEDYLEAGFAVAPGGAEEALPEIAESAAASVLEAQPAVSDTDDPLAMESEPRLEFGDEEIVGGGIAEAESEEPAAAMPSDEAVEDLAAPEPTDVMMAEPDATSLPSATVATEDEAPRAGNRVAEFGLDGGQDDEIAPGGVNEPAFGEAAGREIEATGGSAGAQAAPSQDEIEDEVPPVEVIYVSTEAMQAGDPAALTTIVVEELDYLMFDAGYDPKELPRAAVAAWCASFFVSDSLKEGVGGFAHEAMGEPDLWQACAEGLEAVGAKKHLRIYEELRALLAWDADTAQHIHDDARYGESDERLREIDEALRQAEAEMPLAPLVGAWLKSRPELEVIDEATLEAAVTALAEHPVLVARRKAQQEEAA